MGCAYVDASVCSLMAVYFPDDCLFTRISEHPKPALSKLDQAKDYAYAYTYIHIYIYIYIYIYTQKQNPQGHLLILTPLDVLKALEDGS